MLQNYPGEYEVIILYCKDYTEYYHKFAQDTSLGCNVRLYPMDEPKYFHLGAFRNLGAYYARSDRLIFASIDIVRKSNFLKLVDRQLEDNCLTTAGSFHVDKCRKYFSKIWRYNNRDFKFDEPVNLAYKNFNKELTLTFGTMFVKKDDFIEIGGYDMNMLFQEDAHIDRKFDFYYREKGAEHPIIRLEDAKRYGGIKCKGIRDKDMATHGMIVDTKFKTIARNYIKKEITGDFTPLNMNLDYLKSQVYRKWTSKGVK